jgi:hypothetical protein
MTTETTKPEPELPQTSFEKEHKIEAGAPLTRNEVSQETPEQTKERIDRDIEAGKRCPPPESVDQTKSTVTPEQVKAVEETAWKPARSSGESEDDKGKKDEHKSSSHAPAHGHKK